MRHQKEAKLSPFYACKNSQSVFFKDCFFLEGLEMTLIRLLRKTPMFELVPYSILTDSMKCFLLSESLMYRVLAMQKCCNDHNKSVFILFYWFAYKKIFIQSVIIYLSL